MSEGTMTNVAAAIVVVWILSIAAGVSIGAEKGRLFEGFVFRLCFGVIGLLVVRTARTSLESEMPLLSPGDC
ncbi:MAG TPA: hypothetical protein VKE94_13710 [Gemmataceae bacterium]|nr:hypothetical protein [Gemmataceae bacterium]